jgi:predicted dinucleotide-binding enzyme
MRVGIIGAGRIGGNAARLLAAAGHEVKLSFARDQSKLTALASEIGGQASAGPVAEAAAFGDVVIVSVPWDLIPQGLEQAGDLAGKVVVDTTNQFGASPMPAAGQTAAQFNAARMPGARYTKSFNTLTAEFQSDAAGRRGPARVVQWICGDDAEAKQIVAGLIADAGFAPVDLGGTAGCAVMESPRRAGAVYGEEYRLAEARAVVEAVRAGRPIPPTPRYEPYEPAAVDELTLAERFVTALGTNEPTLLDEIYDPEVALYTPLGWPIRGLDAVKEFVGQFHTGYPGLRVTLHDQFSSADGQRVCFRGRSGLVIVGQSMGAFTAPIVASKVPASMVVLVAPMIPAPGETPGQWGANVGLAEAQRRYAAAAGFDPRFDLMTTFLHDVPEDVVAELMAAGEPPQAGTIFSQPFPLNAWPGVATRVLACTRDRMFPLDLVRRLARQRLGVEADEIDSGHLPGFSRPEELTGKLLEYVAARPSAL